MYVCLTPITKLILTFATDSYFKTVDDSLQTKHINTKGLILLWAFAESGIVGILHALKLPFTGIFVGGIAIICIALLSYFTDKRGPILKALGVVLLVKFTVSPHSLWQAYEAVVFQAYLGFLLFKTNDHFKLNVFCLVSYVCWNLLSNEY